MKQYPSIEYWNKGIIGTNVYAFDKLDGSNIRAEWNKKLSKKTSFTNGFGKFGTRTQLTYLTDPNWGLAIQLFMKKYSAGLDKIFNEDKHFRNARTVTIFAEYFGPNSFAGWHDIKDKENDKMDLILFDVDVFQKGLVKAKDFIEKFEHLGIPKVVYKGIYNEQLIEDVRNNIFGLNEGVVVKGITLTKKKDVENVWMTKIKTNEWLQKVKSIHGDKKLLEELNGDQSLMI
jgi:hypothetical protein